MAIFAVVHIVAFTWKPYAIGGLMAYEPVAAGKVVTYHGGPLGMLALFDAFNPWDQIKACARGIRWLFVGRKTRMMDPSYHHAGDEPIGLEPSNLNNVDYPSPGMGATEHVGVGKGEVDGDEEEVLLANAQPQPTSHMPYDSHAYEPFHPYDTSSTADLGMPPLSGNSPVRYYEPRPMEEEEEEEEGEEGDTSLPPRNNPPYPLDSPMPTPAPTHDQSTTLHHSFSLQSPTHESPFRPPPRE